MNLQSDDGRAILTFSDVDGRPCSLMQSSLATDDAIRFGVEVPRRSRMHLTRDQVAALLPVLALFVNTGELEAEAVRAVLAGAGHDEEGAVAR